MSDLQKRYLHSLAKELIDDEDMEEAQENRDPLWDAMTPAERDQVNEWVEAIFGEWL